MNVIEMERTKGDFGFDIKDEKGHILHTDSSAESGGVNYGFRPTQLLLAGLGSCSAIDIIAILKKQKQVIENFKIRIEGEREPNVTPSLWQTAHIAFELHGPIDPDKAIKATALAMRKYCSVAETLRRGGTKMTWTVKVVDTKK
jgi:putative redox protein